MMRLAPTTHLPRRAPALCTTLRATPRTILRAAAHPSLQTMPVRTLFGNGNSNKSDTNSVACAVLDWSGTVCDAFAMAQPTACVAAFAQEGVALSIDEARGPLQNPNDVNVKELLDQPAIRARWADAHEGKRPTTKDMIRLHVNYVDAQVRCLPPFQTLLPGVRTAIDYMRNQQHVHIGVTTSFPRVVADELVKAAHQQGFTPDVNVASDEVLRVRPHSDMCKLTQQKLEQKLARVRPHSDMCKLTQQKLGLNERLLARQFVKVSDMARGVHEGHNADMWTVGVWNWSAYVGVESLAAWQLASSADKAEARAYAFHALGTLGRPHYLVPDLERLPGVIAHINARLAQGLSPRHFKEMMTLPRTRFLKELSTLSR